MSGGRQKRLKVLPRVAAVAAIAAASATPTTAAATPTTAAATPTTAATAATTTAATAATAATPPHGVRVGRLLPLPRGATVLASVASTAPMHVTVALKPRDEPALRAFATAVSSPGSSVYRAFITPAQFAKRFGPTSAQIGAVEDSLRARGLSPGRVSPNGLSIPVSATAGRLATAFSVTLLRVRLAGRTSAIVAGTAPLLDARIAPLVQGVLGLDNAWAPQPRTRHLGQPAARQAALGLHVATGGPQACPAAQAAGSLHHAYTADQIASAFGFSGLYAAGDEGAGQTIAVYELEPDDPNDIAAFQSCYGTNAPVSYVPIDGGAGTGAGAGEAALDIEQAIALAPKAQILVYQAPNSQSGAPGSGPYDAFSAIISQDRAKVLTASWGQCEPMQGAGVADAENTLFQEAAAQGQSIVSAAGDEGAEDCNGQSLPNPLAAVDDPASQPFVTGVGGTRLDSIGPPPSEQVWNDGGQLTSLLGLTPGAGGGGVSSFWEMPSYQSGAPVSLNLIQTGSSGSACGSSSYCREVPDVSADADPATGYLIYWNGSGTAGGTSGWQAIGGTSAGAPTWAALLALANASSGCHGTPIGFANPALYRAAAVDYSAAFDDVTVGNNDFTGTNGGQFAAGPGYDMASGLGTPNAAGLAGPLCYRPAVSPHTPSSSRTAAPAITGKSLRGFGRGRLKLSFTVTAARGGPAIAGLTVILPRGLRFVTPLRSLTVKETGNPRRGFKATVSHGTLIIRPAPGTTRIQVTISYPTLRRTGKLVAGAIRILVRQASAGSGARRAAR